MQRPDLLSRLAAWTLTLATLCCALPAAAQSMRVLQPAPLRAERNSDTAIAQLGAGDSVTLLQMSAGWVRVQAGNKQGWVRASQVELPGAEIADASQREAGRRAGGANAVTLGVRSLGLRNGRHALIVGLGSYRKDAARPVPALSGLPLDMASALAMALRMNVPRDQMSLLRDASATRSGVQAALADLATQLKEGDRVFVYWAGQGAQVFDGAAGACVQTLLSYDLNDITQNDLNSWLAPVLAKAAQVLFVTDTGTARAICTPAQVQVAPAAANLVMLSAPRPEDVMGGPATAALSQCLMENAARSVAELAACAQGRKGGLVWTINGTDAYVPL